MTTRCIDGHSLGLQDVSDIARRGAEVSLDADARSRMTHSEAWVARAAAGELIDDHGEPMAVYGVNTGYGSLARVRIPPSDAAHLSWNLIRSHAAGVGTPVPADVVRAMMLLRANALAKGASGCRPVIVETLLEMLKRGVHPVVPGQGSCGSSGDLAPLAHLALVLFRAPDRSKDTGGGHAIFEGTRYPGHLAMQKAGIARLRPGPKDGLAMCNGAQLTTAWAALAACDARDLVYDAQIIGAMSFEALRGVTRALHPSVHALRPSQVVQHQDWAALDVAAGAQRSSLPPHLIAQVDDFLARLGPFDPVFVHGDLVAMHAFVEHGRLSGIIDWGDMELGPPARDFVGALVYAGRKALGDALARSDYPTNAALLEDVHTLAVHRAIVWLCGIEEFEPDATCIPWLRDTLAERVAS